MRNDSIMAGVLAQRDALVRRLGALDEQGWDLVCPAPAPPLDVVRLDEPRRTVRETVAHLLVVDEMVLRGGSVRSLGGRPLEHPGAWDLRRVAPLAASPPAELVAKLTNSGARFARIVDAAPAPLRRVPVRGPFGRQSLGRLLTRRVLHEWLHEQDIAAAGAGPAAGAGATVAPVGEAIADAVLQLLPGDILPRTGLDAGVVRLVVEFGEDPDAGQRRCVWGMDFARRQYGPRVLTPAAATIRLQATTLALLAHGRSDRLGPQPCVDIDGDEALASAMLGALGAPRSAAPCLGVAQVARASS